MKILWIGQYASEDIFKEMALKGFKDLAAQVTQSNIINALDELGIPLDTLNAYNIPSSYQDKYVESQIWSRTGNSHDMSVGFKNIKYFSHLLRTKYLKNASKIWALKNKTTKNVIIIVCGMNSSRLSAAIKVKSIIPNAAICLIVPDLPQYMDMAMSITKKVLKRVDWINIKWQLRFVDKYILFTKHMAKFLKLSEHNWMVMEGSISSKDIISRTEIDSSGNKITVMYSGKIDKRYGVIELLRAIQLIKNEDYEFWFTGFGNAVAEIEKQSKVDHRIRYLGFLPSREVLLQKQQEATMLINTRLPTEDGSAYCFPSKLFEYMASGRPVLSFKIDGIPDEYFKYLIKMNSLSAEDISEAIQFVGDLPEDGRKKIGSEAKEYVLTNKSSLKQAKGMLKFLDKIG